MRRSLRISAVGAAAPAFRIVASLASQKDRRISMSISLNVPTSQMRSAAATHDWTPSAATEGDTAEKGFVTEKNLLYTKKNRKSPFSVPAS